MNREESVEVLKDMIDYQWGFADSEKPKSIEALKNGIKALEQESCEDCISRQAVLNEWENTTLRGRTEFDQVIMMLPSVTSQPKIGHWIKREIEDTMRWKECSECHSEYPNMNGLNYCPNCGTKMEGEYRMCEISDEKAVKVLDNILSGYEEYTDHNDVYDACMKGIRAIENQECHWIPVSERLPKSARVYRVTRYYPNNVLNTSYFVDACTFDGLNTWYDDNRINLERAHADNVIAWQENPEPYIPN